MGRLEKHSNTPFRNIMAILIGLVTVGSGIAASSVTAGLFMGSPLLGVGITLIGFGAILIGSGRFGVRLFVALGMIIAGTGFMITGGLYSAAGTFRRLYETASIISWMLVGSGLWLFLLGLGVVIAGIRQSIVSLKPPPD